MIPSVVATRPRVWGYCVTPVTRCGSFISGRRVTDQLDRRIDHRTRSGAVDERDRDKAYSKIPPFLPFLILLPHDMPRNQNPGNVALRNRNRVTNKTRLKVIKGNVDADPVVLDEDEERARVISTAGVDAEDANVSSTFSSHFLPPVSVLARPCWTLNVASSDWFLSASCHSADC